MNPGEADRILFNGTIITVDSADTVAEAVAVKNGKIAAVGKEDAGSNDSPILGSCAHRSVRTTVFLLESS